MSSSLDDDDLLDDPIELFRRWFDAAARHGLPQVDAMTLATADADGFPTARVVLLKAVDGRGFQFFTNYESRKGAELAANPRAALAFLWIPLERQVRVRGTVERLTAQESDAYFATRPRGSQIGAWASRQSQPLERRGLLEQRWSDLEQMYAGREVPRPPHWGGYRVRPLEIEFWQGRENRLHDRYRYTRRDDGTWERVRLQP